MMDVLIAIFCAIPVIGFVFWIDCKYGKKQPNIYDYGSIDTNDNISPPPDCYHTIILTDTDSRSQTMADLTRKADLLIKRKRKQRSQK